MRKNNNSFKILHTPLIEVFKRIQFVHPILLFLQECEKWKVIFWKLFKRKGANRQREEKEKSSGLDKVCPEFLMM